MNNAQFLKVAEEQAEISKQKEIERGKPYKKFSPGFLIKLLTTMRFAIIGKICHSVRVVLRDESGCVFKGFILQAG